MAVFNPSPELAHFVKLARRGAYPAASGGEHASHYVARAILLRVPGLDSKAIVGLQEFVLLAALDNGTAAELLNGGKE